MRIRKKLLICLSLLVIVASVSIYTGNIAVAQDGSAIAKLFNSLTPNRTLVETVTIRGFYTISQTIIIPNYTHVIVEASLEGQNMNVAIFKIAFGKEITVTGGYYRNARKAFLIYGSSSFTIEETNIQNMADYGISISNSHDFQIKNNKVDGFGDDGIAVVDNSYNFLIEGNTAQGGTGTLSVGSSGIEVGDGAHDGIISKNFCHDNVNGININTHDGNPSSFNIIISENIVWNNNKLANSAGISIRRAFNVLVINNIVHHNLVGILSYLSQNVTVSPNILYANAR